MSIRAFVLPAVALTLWGIPALASAAAAREEPVQRVIVQWRDAPAVAGGRTDAARIEQLRGRQARGVTRGWQLGGSLVVIELERAQSGVELAATLASLRTDPDVLLAVPDERVRAQAYTPNDANYAGQWYLRSTDVSAIRANEAWDISRGSNSVIVAVLDTGVRFDHPDLAGKLLQGWDFVSTAHVGNDGDGWDSDPSDPGDFISAADLSNPQFQNSDCTESPSSWHGTRVAGLIAAASDNGVGITGTGFNVRILPVRVLGKCGGYVSDVIAGMYWAAGLSPPPPYMSTPVPPVNTNKARVLNLSLGNDTPCSGSGGEVYRVAVQQITASGSLVVASAGNTGAGVGSPAGCDGVLAVAGLRHAGTKVGYSSLGPEVDIAAPAGNCINVAAGSECLRALNTTTNLGTQGPQANSYSTGLLQPTYGTSFSAPLASGTAALMLSVNSSLTPAQIVQHIRATARPFPTISDTTPQPPMCVSPTVNPLQPTECICTTENCGAGMLDAFAAVLAVGPVVPPPDPDPGTGGGGGGGGGNMTSLLLMLLVLLGLALPGRRVRARR